MRKETIFDGAATIEIPDNYVRWSTSGIPRANQTNDSDDGNKEPDPIVSWMAHGALFRFRDTAYISGIIFDRPWPGNGLDKRLDEYYRTAMRSLPMVRNAEIATRPIPDGDANLGIGMLQYTFATPTQDWFACVALLPAKAQEAAIMMICKLDHAIVGATEFMTIADSIAPEWIETEQE